MSLKQLPQKIKQEFKDDYSGKTFRNMYFPRLISDLNTWRKLKREDSPYAPQLSRALWARHISETYSPVTRFVMGAVAFLTALSISGSETDIAFSPDQGKWIGENNRFGTKVLLSAANIVPPDRIERWAAIAQAIEITTSIAFSFIKWPIYRRTMVLSDPIGTIITPWGSAVLEFSATSQRIISNQTLTLQEQFASSVSGILDKTARLVVDFAILGLSKLNPKLWGLVTGNTRSKKLDADIDRIRAASGNPR